MIPIHWGLMQSNYFYGLHYQYSWSAVIPAETRLELILLEVQNLRMLSKGLGMYQAIAMFHGQQEVGGKSLNPKN